MKIVTIILSEYLEEQNIPSEAKLAKELGPMIPTGDRNESGETIRIPHSGFVHDNVEYKLVGFGKLDKRKYDIPSQVEKDIQKLLGDKGRWFYTEELKLEISKSLKATAWSETMKRIKELRATGNYGPFQAIKEAVKVEEKKEEEQTEDFGAY